MSNFVTGSKLKVYIDGETLDFSVVEQSAQVAAQNMGQSDYIVLPSANFNLKWFIKRIYSGIGAPAAHFLEAAREFGLINEKQCDEGLNHYSARIHARHMKRIRKQFSGSGYKWTRTRSNHIGKK